MSEDNLDNFLLQNSGDNSSQNTVSNTQQFPNATLPNRPKLKKIKRPKIRPTVDIPQAPEKVMPSFQETTAAIQAVAAEENNFATPVNHDEQNFDVPEETSVSAQNDSIQVSDDNISAQNIGDNQSENAQGNSLVRAKDAQYMTSSTDNSELAFSLDDLNNDFEYDEDDDEEILQEDTSYIKKNVMYIAAGICLFVGLFIGKALFSSQTIENHGLEGIVANPDVPAGRPRCGLTDKSQACVFYLMNWERQELNGRDFYKLAAYFTGREEYMIETENLRYATVKIKPGDFAQLNIPALK